MATYAELYDLASDTTLRNRISVAIVVKAHGLLDGATPTVDEVSWSNAALKDPRGKASEIIHYVLAANKSAATDNITGAIDTAIQTNVDSAVDALIAGGAV